MLRIEFDFDHAGVDYAPFPDNQPDRDGSSQYPGPGLYGHLRRYRFPGRARGYRAGSPRRHRNGRAAGLVALAARRPDARSMFVASRFLPSPFLALPGEGRKRDAPNCPPPKGQCMSRVRFATARALYETFPEVAEPIQIAPTD